MKDAGRPEEAPPGEYEFTDYMGDDGFGSDLVSIRVKVTVSGDSIAYDYTGTAPQIPGAMNNPLGWKQTHEQDSTNPKPEPPKRTLPRILLTLRMGAADRSGVRSRSSGLSEVQRKCECWPSSPMLPR